MQNEGENAYKFFLMILCQGSDGLLLYSFVAQIVEWTIFILLNQGLREFSLQLTIWEK